MHLKVEFSLPQTGQTRTRKSETKRSCQRGKNQPKQEKVAPGLPLERVAEALNKPAGGNEGFKWHTNGLPLKDSVKRQ